MQTQPRLWSAHTSTVRREKSTSLWVETLHLGFSLYPLQQLRLGISSTLLSSLCMPRMLAENLCDIVIDNKKHIGLVPFLVQSS